MISQDPLIDSFGRRINYLRISLTDRCNFRCIYCMPAKGLPCLPTSQHLTKEEIIRFVQIASRLGVDRIRLTGGEPLLREDILDIVRSLKKIETLRDLSLTTNGSRLALFVKPLKEVGLDRINISLDSMDFQDFKKITLSDSYREVIHATALALKEGFPVKLNMVVLRSLNDREIIDFARLAYEFPLEVRFLEFMPLCNTGWKTELFLPISEVRSRIQENFDLIEEFHPHTYSGKSDKACFEAYPSGHEAGSDLRARTGIGVGVKPHGNVAQVFRIRGGKGKVGFIAPLTEPFCDECSRIRLTCDGKIRPCLFSSQEVSVKELLRGNSDDDEIVEAIRYAVKVKPKGNPFFEKPYQTDEELSFALASTPLIRSIGG